MIVYQYSHFTSSERQFSAPCFAINSIVSKRIMEIMAIHHHPTMLKFENLFCRGIWLVTGCWTRWTFSLIQTSSDFLISHNIGSYSCQQLQPKVLMGALLYWLSLKALFQQIKWRIQKSIFSSSAYSFSSSFPHPLITVTHYPINTPLDTCVICTLNTQCLWLMRHVVYIITDKLGICL